MSVAIDLFALKTKEYIIKLTILVIILALIPLVLILIQQLTNTAFYVLHLKSSIMLLHLLLEELFLFSLQFLRLVHLPPLVIMLCNNSNNLIFLLNLLILLFLVRLAQSVMLQLIQFPPWQVFLEVCWIYIFSCFTYYWWCCLF